uniref:Uncharacterized protein LOC113790781 n=1 Tax=Dermatophagoides pteronyssinus TaxID=6956 RepID=A0A6P6XWK1_DERPT|nr:uncharacterized protein LOC113790781 [Dermatophagoides pteronyssinus]
MLWKIHHLFYYQFKEIVECRHNRWYQIKHSSETILLSIFSMRITFGMISYMFDENYIQYWMIDPFCFYLIQSFRQLFRQYLTFALILTLLGVFGKFTFFFSRVDTVTFLTVYELVVNNIEQFQECKLTKSEIVQNMEKSFKNSYRNISKSNRFIPDILIRFFCRCRILWQTYVDKYPIQIDGEKWTRVKPLRTKLHVISDDRLKMIKFLTLINPIITILHIGLFFISSIVMYDLYNTVFDHFPNDSIVVKIILMLDIIIIIYNVIAIVQCGLLFVLFSLCYGILLKCLLDRLNRQLKRIASVCRKRNRYLVYYEKFTMIPLMRRTIMFLNYIYRQHSYICYDVLYCYQEIWGNALFGYLMISIPFNVIAVTTLFTEQLTWMEMIIQYIIIIIHAAITVLSLFQFSRETKLLNEAKFHLVPIIQSLVIYNRAVVFGLYDINQNQSTILSLKIKYCDLFNRLTNGRKYGPNVSTVGVITNMFIFNMAITYVGIFIFISSHLDFDN